MPHIFIRRSKMKRILATLLVVVMVLSLAACGKKEETNNNSNNNSSTNNSSNTENKTSDEKVELTMWCIATEGDSNRPAYEKAIETMKTKYPNVTLKWDAFENEAYKEKIKNAMAADDVADIFFTWSCAFLGDFVQQDKVYCLDDVLAKYISNGDIPEVMLGNTTYNGKHYGVPTTMNIVGLFANMDLLKQVGYNDVPATYDDLIACCDKLVAAGIIPFGCAGGETWCVTEYLESIIEKKIGADALNDIFLGRATYNNQGVADSVAIFQEMISKGYFDPKGMALKNDEIKANFMNGQYAFYMNGTWNCADFAASETFFPKVKVAEFPVIDSAKSKLGQLIGGPSDTLAVSKSSKNAAKAAEFAAELGKEICHEGYLLGCGLPAWNVNYDDSAVNALTKTVAGICAKADAYVLFGDTAMSAADKDIYLDYVGKVYASQIDGAGFISGLAKDIR
jgi:raffinose/stachyose/melibiose transport system substrate-binding protein